MEINKNILLFGSSYMAEEYLKVLHALGCTVTVIGRNGPKAEELAQRYSATGLGGGVAALDMLDVSRFNLVIISSAIESLSEVACACLAKGAKNILIEKPGALNCQELMNIRDAGTPGVSLRIAYNRRYYNSVLQLKEIIDQDGGPLGCFFDFTDREMDILENPKSKVMLKRWGFANASHVIDTAFYLVGRPVELAALRSGGWPVHPSGTTFVGHGKTQRCLFSYFATWSGGGRWKVEVSTAQGRYKLSPLEGLQFCKKNQFGWENIPLRDDDDTKFKPGLMKLVKSALTEDRASNLPDIREQISFCKTIDEVFGYEV